jgi:hypothetical protein
VFVAAQDERFLGGSVGAGQGEALRALFAFGHQPIGNDAAQSEPAERDHVGFGDGSERRAKGNRPAGQIDWMRCGSADQVSPTMMAPLAGGPAPRSPWCWVNMAGDFEDFREVSASENRPDLCESHEEEVAEAVAFEPAAGLEAVLEEAGKQRRVFTEATMQFRYLLGCPSNSRRRRPELPPSRSR